MTTTLTRPSLSHTANRLTPRKPVKSRMALAVVRHILIICALLILLYPLVWMVAASLRPGNQTFNGLGLGSESYTLENYINGWSVGTLNFSTYFFNSVAISALSIAGTLFSCTLTAYAFARLSFPFKGILFALLLGTMLLPQHVTLVPKYVLFNNLAWINTYLPLVVPHWLGTEAFYIFLMVQFIRNIPKSLDESARIDGAGHFGIFWRIILPLALPAIGTTAMFTFIATWNDLLGPLLYLTESDRWTVPLGLASFLDQTGQSTYGTLFAMSVLSLAPIVGFFIASQRLLVEGIATTGLK
jgi:multiple sugar transport system permease protein